MGRKKAIKFRASKVGALMTGTRGLTENQMAQLAELEARAAGTFLTATGKVGGYSAINERDHQQLIEKRDAPFELSQTAKSFVEEIWLEREFEYKKLVHTDEILKGHLCEQDSIKLVSELYPVNEFRRKHRGTWENAYFTGHPDVILEKTATVEDIKTSWDIHTYKNIREYPELYFAQGQVYMELTKTEKFVLYYCLISTPPELLIREEKRLYWMFGGESQDYIRASEQLYKNHNYEKIAPEKRVKKFEIERDNDYLKELRYRARHAREYYKTLDLGMVG